MSDDKKQIQIRRSAAIIILVTILLLVCSLVGTGRIDNYVAHSLEESMAVSLEEAANASRQEEMESSIAASVESSIAEETAVHTMEISYMEGQLLAILKEKLDNNDMAGAAYILIENEKEFQDLFYDRLEDGVWFYDGTQITDQVEGHGMVFKKASTLFYGDFKDGKPEGVCAALQAVSLEEGNRYDYSVGTWKAGLMNGSGECGYSYYEGVSDGSAVGIIKQGEFSEDLMEGSMTYSSVDGEGKTTVWSMNVSQGVLVLDDKWMEAEGQDGIVSYQLAADNEETYVYAIDQADAGQVRWKNMIVW